MTISLPSNIPNPASIQFEIVNNTQVAVSTFTNAMQAVEQLGSHWEFSATWKILTEDQVPAFRSFLAKLRGGAETFYFSDVSSPVPVGTISGSPVIASQVTIEQVTISSAPASQTIFKEGDYIEIPTAGNSELKIVTADVVSDGSGNATIDFLPQLRGAAAVGQPLVYENTKGVFATNNRRQKWTITAPNNGEGFTLTGVEWVV